MRLKAIVAGLLVAGATTVGAEPAPEKVIRAVGPVALPAYGAEPRLKFYAPDEADYARTVADRSFVMERITYRSGGLEVFAYLYNNGKRSTWWIQVDYRGRNYIPWAWLNFGNDKATLDALPVC